MTCYCQSLDINKIRFSCIFHSFIHSFIHSPVLALKSPGNIINPLLWNNVVSAAMSGNIPTEMREVMGRNVESTKTKRELTCHRNTNMVAVSLLIETPTWLLWRHWKRCISIRFDLSIRLLQHPVTWYGIDVNIKEIADTAQTSLSSITLSIGRS